MVYLSRIYTKSGDQGETGLGDGSRVPKDHPRVAAYGTVDELNAMLGVFLAELGDVDATLTNLIRSIQHDLFDVGADLCVPIVADEASGQMLRVQPSQSERLEKAIDLYNDRLEPLRSFILPGGTKTSAWLHMVRTVCRRAEREVVRLMTTETINQEALIYLNRLSDLFFVLARVQNDDGKADVLWVPGKNRE